MLNLINVIGLNKGEDGRTCRDHAVCGKSLKPGDRLIFKRILVPLSISNDMLSYPLNLGGTALSRRLNMRGHL